MNTLIYAPDQANFSVEDSTDRLRSEIGHVGRHRRNLINGSRPVDASWQCSKAMYTYLAQAYRAFIASGGDPFLCNLILDNANVVESFQCRFVSGSFGLASVQGETYYVRAKLAVTPKKYDINTLPFLYDASTRIVNLRASGGAYVLTGKAVTFKLSVIHLNAATGVYVLSGKNLNMIGPDRTIEIEAGSYSVSGVATKLAAKAVIAAPGSYGVTGNDITLTKTP